LANFPEPGEDSEEKEKKVRRKHKGRNPFPPHLPREEIVYDLAEEEKSSTCCIFPLSFRDEF
jgi:hypothetical protein